MALRGTAGRRDLDGRLTPGAPGGRGGLLGRMEAHPVLVALLGAIAAAVIGLAVPQLWSLWTGPPPANAVIDVMNQETMAGMTRDPGVIGHIYAPDATVTDAGCQTPGASNTWRGAEEIATRYGGLPAIESLHHVDVSVRWEPANRWASRAEVAADTIGVLAPTGTPPKSQSIAGHERWILFKSGDRWLIQSFTYNLCLP